MMLCVLMKVSTCIHEKKLIFLQILHFSTVLRFAIASALSSTLDDFKSKVFSDTRDFWQRL